MVLALSALLAGLLAVIALIVSNDHEDKQALNPLHADAVSRLVIDRTGRASLVLENTSDSWSLIEPCELPLSTSRVDPLLAALTNVTGSYDRNEVDLSQTGLIEPQLIATIDGVAIAIGAADSSGERRYAMRGDRIGFVPEWVVSLADGGISALAQLDMFKNPLAQLGDVPTSELSEWQDLSAQQIVLWPVEDAPPETSSQTLDLTYANGQVDTLNLIRNERYAAMLFGNSQCAYILSNEDIPD